MRLAELINNLDNFSFEQEQQGIVHENLEELSNLQKSQLEISEDALGRPIELKDNARFGYGYRPFTIEQKKLYGFGLGAVTDRVTFYMTGELYSQLFARMQGNTFEIASHVPYWSTLIKRTQKETNELSENNRLFFATTYVVPGIEKAVQEKVFKR